MDFEYDIMDSVQVFCNMEIEDIIAGAKQSGEIEIENTSLEQLDSRIKQTKRKNTKVPTKLKNQLTKGCSSSTNQKLDSVETEISDQSIINTEVELSPPRTSQRGRARRQFMSDLANKLTPIDNIDLSVLENIQEKSCGTSKRIFTRSQARRPNQRNNILQNSNRQKKNSNVICIGSDEEDANIIYTPLQINSIFNNLNESNSCLDLENPEYSIKIDWLNKIESFPLRKYQKFHDIFEILSKRENAEIKDIMLNLNSKIIEPTDTPDSINYIHIDIISGRVLKNHRETTKLPVKVKKNIDEISIKLQSNFWKRYLLLTMKKTDTFKILYIKCSEELKLSFSEFFLQFDGDNVSMNDTPYDLNLEDGEIIDCVVKK